MNVCVNINHTWPRDLNVTLSHEITSVVLMNRPGKIDPNNPLDPGCGTPNVAVLLDDSALSSVDDICPLVGNLIPNQQLVAFKNQNQDHSGTWTLTVTDLVTGDIGSLTGVQLYFTPP